MSSASRAVIASTYRGHKCLMVASDTGWAILVDGSPILFDLIYADWSPAFSWVDLVEAMAGNGMPRSHADAEDPSWA